MKRSRLVGVFGVVVAAFLVGVAVQLPEPAVVVAQEKTAQIDALLRDYQEKGEFNGSALVAENGQVILEKGYGLANMEWDIPNGPDTKHRLGSVTKQFTAMLVLQLAAAGKLTLEDTISDHLPYYRKDTGSRVTLHHLLTHTSGVPNYTAGEFFRNGRYREPHPVEEFVKLACSDDLEFEPGSKFSYSNSGYYILGAILEAATGKTYENLLKEKIFDPLGMQDTGYDHHETVLPHRAAGYAKQGESYVNARYLDMSNPFAAGALYSTVQDLYKWDQALYTDRLLPAEWRAKMFTPFRGNYAYGWGVRQEKIGEGENGATRTVVGHGGGIFGFNTRITRYVEDRHLIVLLSNVSSPKLAEIGSKIKQILYSAE